MSEYQGTRHDVRYLGIQTGLVAVYADGNRQSRLPSAYTMLTRATAAATAPLTQERAARATCTGKVFERVLLARLTSYTERFGLLHENQNGFRKERSCEELVFVLQQVLEANVDCVAVFVDVRKAYPTVFRDGLFTKLAQKGIGGDMWGTLRNMYKGLTSKVTVGGEKSSSYEVNQGLMEGAILSPWMYTMFIDGFVRRLKAEGLGCEIGGEWAGALYYADDLALLAKNDVEMQKMLRVLDAYCRDWQFQVSYGKTKVLRFGRCRGTHQRPPAQLYLPSMYHEHEPGVAAVDLDGGRGSDTNPIGEAEEYEHLGVTFQTNRRFSTHSVEVARKVRVAGHQLRRHHVVPGGLSMAVNKQAFTALVRSRIEYCAAVWAPPCVPREREDWEEGQDWSVQWSNAGTMERAYAGCARIAAGGSPHAFKSAFHNALGVPEAYLVWSNSILRFWERVNRLAGTRLVKAAMKAAVEEGRGNSFYNRLVMAHQAVHGTAPANGGRGDLVGKDAAKEARDVGVEQQQRARWHADVRSHEEVREDNTGGGMAWNATCPPPYAEGGFLNTVKFGQYRAVDIRRLQSYRTGGHDEPARVGGLRANAVPWRDRICTGCSEVTTAVADVPHRMMCPNHRVAMGNALSKLDELYPGFEGRFRLMPSFEGRARTLLFDVPDGRAGAWGPGVTEEQARVRGTRSVMRYLEAGVRDTPGLRPVE